jgi:hypothetical protein
LSTDRNLTSRQFCLLNGLCSGEGWVRLQAAAGPDDGSDLVAVSQPDLALEAGKGCRKLPLKPAADAARVILATSLELLGCAHDAG